MIPLASRQINALGLLICIASIAFAYFFLQLYLGLDACPLCLIDRGLVMLAGVFFLLGFIFDPAQLGRRLLASGALLFSSLGIAVCVRHLWLQSLPADQVPECSPGLDYMLETFPIGETLHTIFNSAGECAEIQWSLLGLSIPAQTLILFVVLAAIALELLTRKSAIPKN